MNALLYMFSETAPVVVENCSSLRALKPVRKEKPGVLAVVNGDILRLLTTVGRPHLQVNRRTRNCLNLLFFSFILLSFCRPTPRKLFGE